MVIEHGKQELPKFYNPINIFKIFTFLLNLIWNYKFKICDLPDFNENKNLTI